MLMLSVSVGYLNWNDFFTIKLQMSPLSLLLQGFNPVGPFEATCHCVVVVWNVAAWHSVYHTHAQQGYNFPAHVVTLPKTSEFCKNPSSATRSLTSLQTTCKTILLHFLLCLWWLRIPTEMSYLCYFCIVGHQVIETREINRGTEESCYTLARGKNSYHFGALAVLRF